MISQVRPSELATWFQTMSAHGKPLVLDVREPDELQTASIKSGDFELLTIPMGSIPQRLGQLDASRPVACLCHHGARSMRVAGYLESQGFAHVANISGGINAWSLELDPSVARY